MELKQSHKMMNFIALLCLLRVTLSHTSQIQECSSHHKIDIKNCTNLKPILPCKICYKVETEDVVTMCETRPENVTHVLGNIPTETESLVLKLQETDSYFWLSVGRLNISLLSRLLKLKEFFLLTETNKHFGYNVLEMNSINLFQLQSLNLTQLSIRIPLIKSHVVRSMVSNLSHVRILDLTDTAGIGLGEIQEIIFSSRHLPIKTMCLRYFQFPGSNFYHGDMNGFFGNLSLDLNETIPFMNLEELDLSKNGLTYIPAVFSKIAPNLRVLDLSENILIHFENMAMLFDVIVFCPSIVVFNASHQNLFNTNTELYPLSNTADEKLKKSCTEHVENLNGSKNMTDSTCILLKCTIPALYTTFCLKNRSFSNSQRDSGKCIGDMTIHLGENLNELSLSTVHLHQFIMYFIRGINQTLLCFNSSNNLETLRIDSMQDEKSELVPVLSLKLESIIGLSKLKYLSLRNNNLEFTTLHQHKLREMNNLLYLDLSGNSLQLTNESNGFCKIFPNLRHISLQNTQQTEMISLNDCTFLNYVDLSCNQLKNWNIKNSSTTSDVKNLLYLNLSNNQIETFDINAINFCNNQPEIRIDVTGNELVCDCSDESMVFLSWIQEKQNKFTNYDSYLCNNTVNINFIINLKDTCMQIYVIVWSLSSASVVLLLIVIVGTIMVKNRWKIRYCMYKLRLRHRKAEQMGTRGEVIKYDAYVSYASEDRFWVHDILIKKMENKYGFRLCVHYRDFAAGQVIVESILESINRSRSIIVVLSENSLKSEWCNFEMETALLHSIQHNKILAVVKLGELKMRTISSKVSHILDIHPYIQWEEESQMKRDQFWSKLLDLMYSLDRDKCCCFPCFFSYPKPSYQIIDDDDVSILSEDLHGNNTYGSDDRCLLSTTNVELDGYKEKNIPSHLRPHLRQAAIAKKEADIAKQLHDRLKQEKQQGKIPTWPFDTNTTTQQDNSLKNFFEEYKDEFENHNKQFAHDRIALMLQYLLEYERNKAKIYMKEIQKVKHSDGVI